MTMKLLKKICFLNDIHNVPAIRFKLNTVFTNIVFSNSLTTYLSSDILKYIN